MTVKTMNPRKKIENALQLIGKGRIEQALALYEEIGHHPGEDTISRLLYGRLCGELNQINEAIAVLSRIVDEEEDNAEARIYLGIACRKSNEWDKAVGFFEEAVRLAPDSVSSWIELGRAHLQLNDDEKAVPCLEKAIELKPNAPLVLVSLAKALSGVGRSEDALSCARRALKLSPNEYPVVIANGIVLTQLARNDEARECFEKAIKLNPAAPDAYDGLSRIKKFSEKDLPAIRKIEKLLDGGMPARDRSYIHFSLGKMYDDCREWEKAFEHYRLGNLLSKVADEDNSSDLILKNSKKVFTRSFLSEAASWGNDSDLPIFIVGMPRSGTTLVEQIVATHPAVAGAGELENIGHMAETLGAAGGWREYRREIDKDMIAAGAAKIFERLRDCSETALRVTDKMPRNHMFLGLIHLMFPKARILNVVRNPLDTCLSCYFQPFMHLRWAFDFEHIARHYRNYREFMDYWKHVLPPETIIDVSYEDIVERPEREVRRIIEFCGLEWDPVCLEFYQNKRAVSTASVWQVRQPIYQSSRRRWENYASHLRELALAIRPYLSPEDIESFAEHGVDLPRRSWWRSLAG